MNKINLKQEKNKQEKYKWYRSGYFSEYNAIVGYYQVQSVLENARGNSLLDIACGDGKLTAKFCEKFKRVVGVDASGSHIRRARKNCPKAEFYESLIENFELKEKFDTVVILDLLEHVINPVAVLKKSASFLKKDGILIVHVPNALAVNRIIAKIMGTLSNEYELSPFDKKIAGHRRSYDMNLLLKDIKKAGLRAVKTGGVFYKMFSSVQFDWFLKNGLWEKGGYGWGRVGGPKKDWKNEFCRACYEFGKTRPNDCNIIYACIKK